MKSFPAKSLKVAASSTYVQKYMLQMGKKKRKMSVYKEGFSKEYPRLL